MALVFSYADPFENAIIGTSLLIIPHLCMLMCGLTCITENLFHYQLMFVLTTHSFLFKHNHRKHHYHHDDVYGDIFTMIVTRLSYFLSQSAYFERNVRDCLSVRTSINKS